MRFQDEICFDGGKMAAKERKVVEDQQILKWKTFYTTKYTNNK